LTCAEQRSPWQNRLHAAVETAYMRSVEGFICNTRATLRTVRHLAGNNQPAVIAYPAADRVAPSLTEEEVRDRVRRGHSLCVLFIGNLIARKGLDVLLEAFATLREDLPFALDVVGGDEADPLYARQMRTLVKGLGLADRVVFHGHVEGESLRDLYRQADVLAVPSSYEGFGIVYLEGMAFGLPAIATLQGGAREVVTHAENGFLVPYGAVDRIAGFLRLFARRGDLLERFSLAALQRYERHDTWAQSMGRAVAFMERMASGHSRP
jgi:glycosyltransferase involved in cell wall biosynthesis